MQSFKKVSSFFIGLSLIIITTLASAEKLPKALGLPSYVGEYVNDFANVIDEHDVEEINLKLKGLEAQYGIKMVVVTIDSLKPYKTDEESYQTPLVQFSIRLFNHWEVGKKTDDKGVLLLIVDDEKKVRVKMGSGFSHSYNDGLKKIINEQLIPELHADNFSLGVAMSVQEIIDTVTAKPDVIFGMGWLKLSVIAVLGIFVFKIFPLLFTNKTCDSYTIRESKLDPKSQKIGEINNLRRHPSTNDSWDDDDDDDDY